jgi:hypothetical protein
LGVFDHDLQPTVEVLKGKINCILSQVLGIPGIAICKKFLVHKCSLKACLHVGYLVFVLVHLCCQKKIPDSGKSPNNRNLFLTALEAGKFKIKAMESSVPH